MAVGDRMAVMLVKGVRSVHACWRSVVRRHGRHVMSRSVNWVVVVAETERSRRHGRRGGSLSGRAVVLPNPPRHVMAGPVMARSGRQMGLGVQPAADPMRLRVRANNRMAGCRKVAISLQSRR
jgi:hypothetical protein